MPPKKDKKDKKPRKPRAKKEKKITQKQTQTQIVNVHLGGRAKPRAKSAPKVSQIPQTFISMNAPPIPFPLQPIPPMREPLKERTAPSRLVGMLPTADNLQQGIAEAEAAPTGYDIAEATPIRRGRPSLDPAVLKERKEQAEMERERKRKEKELRKAEREFNTPLPRPRGRPKKSGEGAGSKAAAETESGYEN